MTLQEEAQHYRDTADSLLRDSGLLAALQKHGEVVFDGSYAANVMMHGDIDIGIVREKAFDMGEMFDIAKEIHFATTPNFMSYYIKSDWADPKLGKEKPFGRLIMLKALIQGERWNLDIWFVGRGEADRLKNRDTLDITKTDLTNEQREKILEFKKYRKDNKRDMPGQRIYEAVLNEGATDPKQLFN